VLESYFTKIRDKIDTVALQREAYGEANCKR
jgi:hypothetical protein